MGDLTHAPVAAMVTGYGEIRLPPEISLSDARKVLRAGSTIPMKLHIHGSRMTDVEVNAAHIVYVRTLP